LFQLCVFIN
jgi:hypothetical protein